MPLSDRDPNANMSGRTSRASNMSTGSRGMSKGPPARSDLLSAAPGVMSMLRTSTEMGNLGSITLDSSGIAVLPRAAHRRHGASSRLSTSSSHSQGSSRTVHHGPRRSMTRENNVPQFSPDTLSPTVMNIPGSSDLIPPSRFSRDGGRSYSLTHTSQPAFGLSSNRSMTSLRHQDIISRPQSPYRYPTRLRRPGYRPASPAMSDITGTHPRRVHGQPVHPKMRTPSVTSIHHDDRLSLSSQRGHALTPNLYPPHSEIPLPRPTHTGYARFAHTPAKASVSSGSFNMRSDSEAPSSDTPSSQPPTPKDDTSMEVLLSPTKPQVLGENVGSPMKTRMPSAPLYYDYSEDFAPAESMAEPEEEGVPVGFTHRIKTILEERKGVENYPPKDEVAAPEIAELPTPDVIAELPASPVPKRITRQMIIEALDLGSTTEEMSSRSGPDDFSDDEDEVRIDSAPPGSSRKDEQRDRHLENMKEPQITMRIVPFQRDGPYNHDSAAATEASTSEKAHEPKVEHVAIEIDADNLALEPPEETKRQSTISRTPSQTTISAGPDSSTIEFAVRCSIPTIVQGRGAMPDVVGDDDSYDQTKDTRLAVDHGVAGSPEELRAHTPKSSMAKSFKSCKETDDKSCKDSDDKSFKTAKGTVTPDKAEPATVPLVIPSLNLRPDVGLKRPASAMPSESMASTLVESSAAPPGITPRSSIASRSFQRIRAGSRVGSRQDSTVASISSSVDTVSQSPSIPSRGSSSSKEAQRTTAVAEFLLKLSRPNRFARVQSLLKRDSNSSKKSTESRDGLAAAGDGGRNKAASSAESVAAPKASAVELDTNVKEASPEPVQESPMVQSEAVDDPTLVELPMSPQPNESSPITSSQTPLSIQEYRPLSTPLPVMRPTSSVYTSAETSSRKSVGNAAAFESSSPFESGLRDSNTTTHLSWNNANLLTSVPEDVVDVRAARRFSQDDTTTDLRLSAYRYGVGHLPDLKEESHEDSSINTSASNLKGSSFRFPFVRGTSVRMSADDARILRSPSFRSLRRPSLGHTRKLPSLNFSGMDLLEKLNEGVDLRRSKSLDGQREELGELVFAAPERPSSAGEVRDKYKSVFGSLDEADKPPGSGQTTSILDLNFSLKRSVPTEALISEIDNLSIPSVGGLTERLSRMFPSLSLPLQKFFQDGEMQELQEMDDEDKIMAHAREQLQGVAPHEKRSSARLRPLPGNANLVIIDDSVYEELTGKEKDNAGADADACVVDGEQGGSESSGVVNHTKARETTTSSLELEAPSPLFLRTRSLSLGSNDIQRSTIESRLSYRSLSSLDLASTTETRPWNIEKNYPWASNTPDINIGLPTSTAASRSPRIGPSPLRHPLSNSFDENDTTNMNSISDMTVAGPSGTSTRATADMTRSVQANRPPRLSMFFDEECYRNPDDRAQLDANGSNISFRRAIHMPLPDASDENAEARSHFSSDSDKRKPRLFSRARRTGRPVKSTTIGRSPLSMEYSSMDQTAAEAEANGKDGLAPFEGAKGMSKFAMLKQRVKNWFARIKPSKRV